MTERKYKSHIESAEPTNRIAIEATEFYPTVAHNRHPKVVQSGLTESFPIVPGTANVQPETSVVPLTQPQTDDIINTDPTHNAGEDTRYFTAKALRAIRNKAKQASPQATDTPVTMSNDRRIIQARSESHHRGIIGTGISRDYSTLSEGDTEESPAVEAAQSVVVQQIEHFNLEELIAEKLEQLNELDHYIKVDMNIIEDLRLDYEKLARAKAQLEADIAEREARKAELDAEIKVREDLVGLQKRVDVARKVLTDPGFQVIKETE